MHSEYAVEPAAIGADWETFRYLIEKFGFDRGRLITRMPNKWEKKVIAAAKEAGVPDVRMKSIVERLRSAKRQRVVDFGRAYEPETAWLDNALRENGIRPFRAIICVGGGGACAGALAPDECDDDNPLMSAPISANVARTADALSEALLPLALTAQEIDIVDPFFDIRPTEGDFISPLSAMLAKLAAHGCAGRVIRIHYRTHGTRPPDTIVQRDAPRFAAGHIPNGFSLQLFEWGEVAGGEDFHDRFFLTNFGGLQIGAGLSVAGPDETATFTLLDDVHSQELRARFDPASGVYTKIGSTVQIDAAGNAQLI